MSAHIVTPKNADVAIVMLPDGQNPFGDKCNIARDIQSVFFHYGLRDVDVAVLDEEGFTSADKCQWVNPDGNADNLATFEECIASKVKPKLFIRPIKAAIRRILSDDPFAAIVTPPAKRPRTDDVDADAVSSASSKAKDDNSKSSSKSLSKSSSKASSKTPAKSSSKSSKADDGSGTDSSNSDGENDDAGSSAGVDLVDLSNLPCIPGTSSKAKDLNQLFSVVGTEVSFWCCYTRVNILILV